MAPIPAPTVLPVMSRAVVAVLPTTFTGVVTREQELSRATVRSMSERMDTG